MAPGNESASSVRIEVTSARHKYSVIVGAGVLQQARSLMEAASLSLPATVVSSAPIWTAQGDRVSSLTAGDPVLMADGERAKTLRSLSGLYDAFAGRGIDRAATIIGFGGGVVGDVAGFAAASYLRGLTYVQIPTTLLAQVDSAIGGKVGVNLPTGKNLVGAFHPPALVIADPTVLGTLKRREFRAGLYEVVKYGVIASRPLFERVATQVRKLLSRNAETLAPVITECCRIKADIVSADEFEAGPRRVLNFGHTIGHALEAVTSYRRFRHGEAIGYGMLAAAHISRARGLMPQGDADAVSELVHRLGPLPGVADLTVADVIDATTHDKKRVAGTLHFVLSAGIGQTQIVKDVTRAELEPALRAIGLS
ncbi:MAG TPA: 3-dehydroquinate synthase [Vicinamibacterales bacterium]|nr:3-dehydroquinate synthase [Vicinamibacterales bacterium]